jgi:hypothetical protein
VIAAANEQGIAMAFTGERHFRHLRKRADSFCAKRFGVR